MILWGVRTKVSQQQQIKTWSYLALYNTKNGQANVFQEVTCKYTARYENGFGDDELKLAIAIAFAMLIAMTQFTIKLQYISRLRQCPAHLDCILKCNIAVKAPP